MFKTPVIRYFFSWVMVNMDKNMPSAMTIKYKASVVLVLVFASALFASYLGNYFLSFTNRFNEEIWIPHGIQHETKITREGIKGSLLQHGKLILGNNSSLYLKDSCLTVLKDYSITVNLCDLPAPGGEIKGDLLKIMLFKNSNNDMISFNLSADAFQSSALIIVSGRQENILAEVQLRNYRKDGKSGQLQFVFRNRELSVLFNGRKCFATVLDLSFIPAFALMSTKNAVSIANIDINSLSPAGSTKEIIKEDFKNKLFFISGKYFYWVLFMLFFAAIGVSLKGEVLFGRCISGEAGPGRMFFLALPYLSGVFLVWPARLINNYGLQMLSFMMLFTFTDGLVKAVLMRKWLLRRPKSFISLLGFLLYKPGIIMLSSLAFIITGRPPGYLLFISSLYACILLIPAAEFLVTGRKYLRHSQPAILIILLLIVILTEVSIRHTVFDMILSRQVSRSHLADDYLGWIRKDLLNYSPVEDVNNFSVGYNEKNKTIICFGGSTTEYGTVVSAKDFRYDYPYFLSKELTKRGAAYNVLNFGVSGWTTFQIRLFLETYYKKYSAGIKPDMAIFYIGHNDLISIQPGASLKDKYELKKRENRVFKLVRNRVERIRLYNGLRKLTETALTGKKSIKYVRAVSLKDTAESIDVIIDYFSRNNIKTVFIMEVMVEPSKSYLSDNDIIKKYLMRKSDGRGVFYIDAREYLLSFATHEIFSDQVHFSRRGAELFAAYILDKLETFKLIN